MNIHEYELKYHAYELKTHESEPKSHAFKPYFIIFGFRRLTLG